MRLSQREIDVIKEAALRHFGADAEVRLFGSRTDDTKKGGDIDLYVSSSLADAEQAVRAEAAFWSELQARLGDQRIDILVDYPTKQTRPSIYQKAREQGLRL